MNSVRNNKLVCGKKTFDVFYLNQQFIRNIKIHRVKTERSYRWLIVMTTQTGNILVSTSQDALRGELLEADRSWQPGQDVLLGALHHHQRAVLQQLHTQQVLQKHTTQGGHLGLDSKNPANQNHENRTAAGSYLEVLADLEGVADSAPLVLRKAPEDLLVVKVRLRFRKRL